MRPKQTLRLLLLVICAAGAMTAPAFAQGNSGSNNGGNHGGDNAGNGETGAGASGQGQDNANANSQNTGGGNGQGAGNGQANAQGSGNSQRGGQGNPPVDPPATGAGDEIDARAAVRAGRAVPLETILQATREITRGELIDVKLVEYRGFLLYEVKVLEPSGRVKRLTFYARSGWPVR